MTGRTRDIGSVIPALDADVARLLELLGQHRASVIGIAVLLAAVAAVAREWAQRSRHRRMWTGARLVTVLAPPRVDDDGAEALWGNLAGLLRPAWRRVLFGQPHLAFEYRVTAQGAVIQMWVPGPVPPGLVERAIASAWPGATTTTTHLPLPTAPVTFARRVATGGTLRLARSAGLPIGADAPGDPAAALLAAAGDLPAPDDGTTSKDDQDRDEVMVQVLARPAPTRRPGPSSRGHLGGSRVLDAAAATVEWVAKELLTLLTPGRITPGYDGSSRGAAAPASTRVGSPAALDSQARLHRSSGDRAVVAKARRATFETVVRYAATTQIDPTGDRDQARRARRVVRGRAHAVAAVFASFTDHNFYRRRHLRRPARVIAARRFRRGDHLSAAELAAIATLPTGPAPGLTRAGARSVSPPPGIPRPGPDTKPLGDTTTNADTTAGGDAQHRGRPVGVSVVDARHHLHVIGATGSGKSTLLVQMILADIRQHRGVIVIDPKGDLVTDVLAHLPAAARARAVLIDPSLPRPPPNLNPLTTPSGPGAASTTGAGAAERRALAVENLVAICRGVFAAYWGPRTDDLLRTACHTLIAQDSPRSLADLPDLLADRDFRASHMRAVTDPVLRGFWAAYERLPESRRAEMAAPLLNKVRALLLRPFTRALLTAAHPDRPADRAAEHTGARVDMHSVLDGGILLARIPKGSLGEEGTRLVGAIIVAQAWTAATARAATPQHLRRDAALVIDECHNFLHLPVGIDDLLAEARGLRLSLTLAHQNLAQLPRDLRAGISTNARNKIFFTVGPDDARDLARHTTPRLDEHDLAHLDAFHAAARLVHHDAETPAFTLRTRPLPAHRETTSPRGPHTGPAFEPHRGGAS